MLVVTKLLLVVKLVLVVAKLLLVVAIFEVFVVLELYKFKDLCCDPMAWSDDISYQDFDSSFEDFYSR